jgi:hypothetical protein
MVMLVPVAKVSKELRYKLFYEYSRAAVITHGAEPLIAEGRFELPVFLTKRR